MKKLLKYLKEYHIDIYSMLIESSLTNEEGAFYYDIRNKKLFKYSIQNIEDYYKESYKNFSWNVLLIEKYLYDVNNFDIEIYSNYNNFLSVKKLKKIINNDVYYMLDIKKELLYDFKTADKKKKNTIANLLYNLNM